MLLIFGPIVIMWLVCAVLAYGVLFANFQGQASFMARNFERRDQRNAVIWAFFLGPIIMGIWATDRMQGNVDFGFKWKREYN